MTPGVLVVVPPTVGHVNHGIALALLCHDAGLRPILVTGSGGGTITEHLSRQELDIAWHCLTTLDLNTDRTDPSRRPHLEQLCHPESVAAARDDLMGLAERYAARLIIGKDYPAAVLAAAELSIGHLGYFTDGIESFLPRHTRQTVADADRLTADIAAVARTTLDRGFPDLLRSPTLNIVRGLPETSTAITDSWKDAEPIAFTGFLTFDAPPDRIRDWRTRLQRLPRPLTYVSFGTVLSDQDRYLAVAEAARRLPGTVLLAALSPPAVPFGDNVVVERYVPNIAALENADVVVHHGGHGTMLTAMSAGVPQVVIPDNPRTSQELHGRRLVQLGIGALLSAPPGDDLVAAVTSLSAAPVRSRATDLAAELTVRSRHCQETLRSRLADLAVAT